MYTHTPYHVVYILVCLTTYTFGFFDFFTNLNKAPNSYQSAWNLFNFWPQHDTSPPSFLDTFDYIVVGAGAAGCPLAFTLAEAGYSTLLIERGISRQEPEAHKTLTINGLSNPINNPLLSQLIVTPQGIRTHIAHIIGGGTSLNLGIYTEETSEFFKYLETFPGVEFDHNLISKSTDWVFERTSSPMENNDSFHSAWKKSMEDLGYTPHTKISSDTPSGQEFSPQNDAQTEHSRHLLMDKYWGGMSLFNSSEGYFRNAADVLLYDQNGKLPDTLKVITQHNVERVIFDTDGDTPKATCVDFRKISKDQHPETISSRLNSLFQFDWEALVNIVSDPLSSLKKILYPPTIHPLQRACVYDKGEIILSSGAIMSSVLLFKSGVGPSDVLENLSTPFVKEVPKLGKNFSDRVFIPVGFFFNDNLPTGGHFDGRICRGIGLLKTGHNCSQFEIGEENQGCSLVPIEEFSGAEIGENIFYATRYVFPPEWRDHPILELFFEFFEKCSFSQTPFGVNFLKPFCKLVGPITDCLKKSGSNFYITAEPKSRGEVLMKRDGTVIANPNYLTHEQDLLDAIRGVATLTNQINTEHFKPLVEKYHKSQSCPATIYNGMLEIITQLAEGLNSQQLNLKRIFPMRSLFEQIKNGDPHKKMDYSRFERTLENLDLSEFSSTFEKNGKIPQTLESELDILLTEIERHFIDSIEVNPDGQLVNVDHRSLLSRIKSMAKNNIQWAATFPPTLPDATNAKELASYAMTYMSSVWHHCGTASFGQVVDKNFNVMGLEGISIVDAGNLNQMTRLNPSATIMMLGRYAGLKKVQNREDTS